MGIHRNLAEFPAGNLQKTIGLAMGYFAFLVPAYTGHLNPTRSLCRELVRRGHRIAWLSTNEAEPFARADGFEFFPIASAEFPGDTFSLMNKNLGELTGLKATRFA